ncbi:MAG: SAM-dependent methyltransferase [Acidobacteria bacterium]|nr:SAM-dependent methyltransferase [Acidobacteriota bacterium]
MRDNHINVPAEESRILEERIRAEIDQQGPIRFERFMEMALYAPGLGYYVRRRDPFGRGGDFYTAEQLQPVFGVLIAQAIASLRKRAGSPAGFRVVELGAGRGEMAAALDEFGYTAIEALDDGWPDHMTGVVFANEFFDALPVRVAVRRGRRFIEQMVNWRDGRFVFVDGGRATGELGEYLARYYANVEDGATVEAHLGGLKAIDRIAAALDGYLVAIDYGYTTREFVRHTAGTLMSYRRHVATPDVLADPGDRDITSHVPFSVLEDRLKQRGATMERFSTLASFLLDAGEADEFAAAIECADEKEALRRRMQLKTLMFGMGETFRVMMARCVGRVG